MRVRDASAVLGLVSALEHLAFVEGPVPVEVSGQECCAEQQDGLGTCGAPACASDAKPAADEVAAGAFNDAGSDREARLQCVAVAHVGGQSEHVLGAAIHSLSAFDIAKRGGAAHAGGDLARVSAFQ